METPEHVKQWKRIAGDRATLLRSRIEIAALLQAIVDGGQPLLCSHQVHDHLFIARLHRVCAEQNYILVGFSDNKIANAEIFAAPSVVFGACHRLGHVSFVAANPVAHYDRLPTIRFDFPATVFVEQRRVSQRIYVIPAAGLHCLADHGGVASFEASIVDIGMSGMGVMVHDAAITLPPGTILRACRIELPDGGVAAVDIEVIHSTPVVQADGRPGWRVGCRFIATPEQIEPLLKVFMLDLQLRVPPRAD